MTLNYKSVLRYLVLAQYTFSYLELPNIDLQHGAASVPSLIMIIIKTKQEKKKEIILPCVVTAQGVTKY